MVLWSGPRFSWPLDVEQLDAYLAESRAGTRLVWTASDSVSAAPLGHVSLAFQNNGKTGRLGRVLVAPNARHVGHGRAVTQAAVTAGFNESRIDAMTLGVYRHNTIAATCMNNSASRPRRSSRTPSLSTGNPGTTSRCGSNATPDDQAATDHWHDRAFPGHRKPCHKPILFRFVVRAGRWRRIVGTYLLICLLEARNVDHHFARLQPGCQCG